MPIVEFAGLPFLHLTNRGPLKDVAVQVTKLQRSGDMGAAVQQLDSIPELGPLGVRDAILGQRELGRVPWSPISDEPVHHTIDYATTYRTGLFEAEAQARGASIRHLDSGIQRQEGGGRSIVVDVLEARSLGATGPAAAAQRFRDLTADGDLVINPSTLARNEKDVMGEVWQAAGVPTPQTVTRIRSLDEAMAAYEQLGVGEVVLKATRGALGKQVRMATDRASVQDAFERLPQLERGILMQVKENIDNADFRLHFSRDHVTGLLHPVGGVERANLGAGFKTNLSGDGIAGVRPVYDFDGSDPRLTVEAVDAGRRAGDAMGYDAFAVDVALRTGTREPLVIEADLASMILDRHFPVPREHGVMKHMADLAMFGDAAAVSNARGASLVQRAGNPPGPMSQRGQVA